MVRTHTFRHLGGEPYNISVEHVVGGHDVLAERCDDDDAGQIRWNKAVCKGAKLLDGMASDEKGAGSMFKPPRESGESDYQDSNDLYEWGYLDEPWDPYYDLDISLPIKAALSGLGVDASTLKDNPKANNRLMQLEHEKEVTVDGITYQPTGARFSTVYNPKDGVIVAWSSYGARHEGSRKTPPITALPKLQNWSDVAWLEWIRIAGDRAASLRFVLRSPVVNTESQWLIDRALHQATKEPSAWPGVDFSMETDEGKAILASPNGLGVAYLLFTHKRKLGLKTISKVTVFQDGGTSKPRPPSLVYHVVDIPPLPKEDESGPT